MSKPQEKPKGGEKPKSIFRASEELKKLLKGVDVKEKREILAEHEYDLEFIMVLCRQTKSGCCWKAELMQPNTNTVGEQKSGIKKNGGCEIAFENL